jgi:predicted dehydrogenase
MLDEDAIQVISIATPPDLHCEIAAAAATRGKHVLCEKPMGLGARQASRMVSSTASAGVVNMVDYGFRVHPMFIRMRELISQGEIGELHRVDISWLLGSCANPTMPWRWQHAAPGGGTMFAFGSHVVDYVEWLLGPIGSVCANLSISVESRPQNAGEREVTAEDSCDVLMMLRDGTPVNIAVSNVSNLGRGHWIEAFGSNGTLVLRNENLADVAYGFRLLRGPLADGRSGELAEVARFDGDDSGGDGRIWLFSRMAEKFLEAVRERKDASPTFRDGLRAQLVMDAIRRSHESRAWAEVEAE